MVMIVLLHVIIDISQEHRYGNIIREQEVYLLQMRRMEHLMIQSLFIHLPLNQKKAMLVMISIEIILTASAALVNL